LEVTVDNKENVFQANPSAQMLSIPSNPYGSAAQPQKRMKHNTNRLPTLNMPQSYDPTYAHPFTFAPQNMNLGHSSTNAWRDGLSAPPPHLSPYPQDVWVNSAPPTEYARSPMPEIDMHAQAQAQAQAQVAMTSSATQHTQAQPKYATHLAPILTTGSMNGTPSPIESPAFTSTTSAQSSYFPRSHTGHSYMQQQQLEYLQQHQHQQPTYDYGSPYLADWDQTYTTA
jgi:hypothetical protein